MKESRRTGRAGGDRHRRVAAESGWQSRARWRRPGQRWRCWPSTKSGRRPRRPASPGKATPRSRATSPIRGPASARSGQWRRRWGPVSILVNNAGITRDNILLRMRDDEWSEVVSTNLGGAFNMTRAVSRGMMKRRHGSIVNISSVIGLIGNPGQANYAASKAGLHGLTRSVARELASLGGAVQRGSLPASSPRT